MRATAADSRQTGSEGFAWKPGQEPADQHAYHNADKRVGCEAAAHPAKGVSTPVKVKHVRHRDVGGGDKKGKGGSRQRIILPDSLKRKRNGARIRDRLEQKLS